MGQRADRAGSQRGPLGAAFTRKEVAAAAGLCSGALGGTGVLGRCTESRLQGARRPQESRKEALQEPRGGGQDPVRVVQLQVTFEGGAAGWIVRGCRGAGERKGGRLWASFPREAAGSSGSRW